LLASSATDWGGKDRGRHRGGDVSREKAAEALYPQWLTLLVDVMTPRATPIDPLVPTGLVPRPT
jgi:hypothetical protein